MLCTSNMCLQQASAQAGFWVLETNFTTGALQTFACPPGFCQGATDGTQTSCGTGRIDGSENVLCGQCLPGYAGLLGCCLKADQLMLVAEWNSVCVPCSVVNRGLVFAFFLVTWYGRLCCVLHYPQWCAGCTCWCCSNSHRTALEWSRSSCTSFRQVFVMWSCDRHVLWAR